MPAFAPPIEPGLPFTARALLAPMEGVTDRLFRSLVLARNPSSCLGGATTEFVRVVDQVLPLKRMQSELDDCHYGRPVGVQLMGSDVQAVAGSAQVAVQAGAPFIDLNFGCPAKGALRGCAGSALLDSPAQLGDMVASVARAIEGTGVPLTAKLRAGGESDALLEDLVQAASDGGAAMITVHCRTRKEGYRDTADWERLRRAVAASAVPVCGNGGVETHADLQRLLDATGCAFVMVGRAALKDPWMFSDHAATHMDVLAFFEEYQSGLIQRGARTQGGRSGSRLKQLASYWTAGPGGQIAADRQEILRLPDDLAVLAAIRERCLAASI